LIGVGISQILSSKNNAITVAELSGLSGIATEFISAVFFYLYNKTVIQMKEYHDSLLAVQNVLLSFKLVGDTTDPAQKAKMIEEMLRYLVRPTANNVSPRLIPNSLISDLKKHRRPRDQEEAI